MKKIVMALGCHPDDIEFMMAGTLLLCKEAGCETHYMNMANGSCGTASLSPAKIIGLRAKEGKKAAAFAGAKFHKSLVNDIEVYYEDGLIRKIAGKIREVKPDLLLIPSLEDYMEDHMNTARIAVTAAFCRGMRNYRTTPSLKPVGKDMALYHALPYGLKDGMQQPVIPKLFVDISGVIEKKTEMLGIHKTQKDWLDKSQGLYAYLKTMRDMSRQVGKMSKKYKYAEGWRMHSPLGFSSSGKDTLSEILEKKLVKA
jgi:LmbE family N-acetylglucosaminyl deacetylase